MLALSTTVLAASAGEAMAPAPLPPVAAASPAESLDIAALYAAATAALAANQPEIARGLLETIVGARPEFAGAWLDLALAAYRSGDIEAGLEHLDYLRSHFVLPTVIARQVDYWRTQWQQPEDVASWIDKPWHGEWTLGVGYDSNVNAGLASNSLSLTLSDGIVQLPVDRTSRPYSDRFAFVGLTAWGPTQATGRGSLTPVILLRNKQQDQRDAYTSLDLQAGAIYLHPAADAGNWRFTGLVQHYRLDGTPLSHALRLDLQKIQPWAGCQVSVGGEVEKRYPLDETDIGGHMLALTGGVSCPLSAVSSLSGLLRLGYIRPRSDWPGGAKKGQEIVVQYSRPIGGDRRAELTWRANRLNDEDGYSPLLDNGVARRIFRQNISLGVRQPLGSQWEALFSAEYLTQHANLELFRYTNRLFMVSAIRRF